MSKKLAETLYCYI